MKFKIQKMTLAISLLITLGACSPNSTPEEQIAEAQSYLQQDKPKSAVILLKKSIVQSPKAALPRFLLGSSYLQIGSVVSAEKELLLSLDLGFDVNLVAPLVFKSLLAQQKYEDIVLFAKEWDITDKEVQGIVWAYEVIALIGQEELSEAKRMLDKVNSMLPNEAIVQVSNAYYQAATNNISSALSIVNQVLLEQPESIEAIDLKGNLSLFTKDNEEAISAYKRYLNYIPINYQVQIKLAKAYVQDGNFDEAEKIADALFNIAPENALLHQIKGVSLYAKEEISLAKYHIEKAIQNGMRNRSNQLIAGVIYFREKNYEQAYYYLNAIRDTIENGHSAKKILAITELALGYNTNAGQTLSELEIMTAEDEKLLTEASLVLSSRGDRQAAKNSISQLDSVAMHDPDSILKLGALKLYLNDVEGLIDIEKVVASSPEDLNPKVVLFTAYLEANDFAKALAIAELLKKDIKSQLIGFNLAALVHIKKNEIEKATDNYTGALDIDENNVNSLVFFASQAWKSGDLNLAKGYVERILKERPMHIFALKMNLSIDIANNEVNESLTKIKNAYKAQPDMPYRLLLVDSLFKLQEFNEIIPLLNDADVALDENTNNQVWVYLIRSYQLTNEIEKAIDVANKWSLIKPEEQLSWLYAIDLLDNQQKLAEALTKTESALLIHPQSARLKVLYSYFLLHSKQIEKAKEAFNSLIVEAKALPLGLYLQGNFLAIEGSYQEALNTLNASYKASNRAKTAHLIYFILQKLNQATQAHEFLEQHLVRFPKDIATRLILADNYMETSRDKAINHYLYLVNNNVVSATVLNNLAWLQLTKGEYEKAKGNIEKALELNSNSVSVLDTAADINLKLNKKEVAKEYLNKALLIDVDNLKIKAKLEAISN
ncbi:PEP-CTERM system TPR-repeat protein PrsT [Colwellia sp. 4_MG-2023]|uniref:XrtA/PEP-CTERM system TPR-repeat protein PrsT n=1 Tax=unclassified Colwellia TaxID=196834 RepID=UPI0026E391AC|nr:MULTISPECIES: XrtA/PEP-CTERM system TPR-repeat protein PrsT [unclassified Colwellia]MDO6506822.1 PEP-CTERM system TPR-repeat protein PrsT [Colwellia sp. 5_MG-2023]MDO6555803.1 PEP-CTERM system TPR-repeat protein PrsT [Colwellia sp. 4_MG-2023]